MAKKELARIMTEVRSNPIKEFNGEKVVKVIDYKMWYWSSKIKCIEIYFGDESWVTLRPSGTEPKIKIYVNAIADSMEKAKVSKKD